MISTRGRYALRIMADIALHDGETPVSVREISARQEISGKYMEQIVQALVRDGLLASVRGAQGGYHLTCPPQEIPVGRILRATEGDLAPSQCLSAGSEGCVRSGVCPSQHVFSKIYRAVNEVIDTMMLSELLEDERISEECCKKPGVSES